jgi:hypothetical protein
MDIDTPPEEIKVRLRTNLIYILYTFVHWRVIYKLFFAASLNSKMAAIVGFSFTKEPMNVSWVVLCQICMSSTDLRFKMAAIVGSSFTTERMNVSWVVLCQICMSSTDLRFKMAAIVGYSFTKEPMSVSWVLLCQIHVSNTDLKSLCFLFYFPIKPDN